MRVSRFVQAWGHCKSSFPSCSLEGCQTGWYSGCYTRLLSQERQNILLQHPSTGPGRWYFFFGGGFLARSLFDLNLVALSLALAFARGLQLPCLRWAIVSLDMNCGSHSWRLTGWRDREQMLPPLSHSLWKSCSKFLWTLLLHKTPPILSLPPFHLVLNEGRA